MMIRALGLLILTTGMAQAQAGSQRLALDDLDTVFSTVCIETAPTFEAATQAMATAGVTRDEPREEGLRYHTELNLSMKIFENEDGAQLCSLLYASDNRPRQEGDTIRKSISGALGVETYTRLREDLLQFDTGAGETLLLWGPMDLGDGFHRVVLIHE